MVSGSLYLSMFSHAAPLKYIYTPFKRKRRLNMIIEVFLYLRIYSTSRAPKIKTPILFAEDRYKFIFSVIDNRKTLKRICTVLHIQTKMFEEVQWNVEMVFTEPEILLLHELSDFKNFECNGSLWFICTV